MFPTNRTDASTVSSVASIKRKFGALNFQITCDDSDIMRQALALYQHFPETDNDEFIDFNVNIKSANSFLRKFIKPQANFYLDNHQPFKPLPANQGFPMLEWGMNWCIANHCHQYLIIHAAVIHKNGVTVLMPAPPGSGKSTLTALLVYSGWRLLSDELALIRVEDQKVDALARPINLKNYSIDVIKQKFPHINHSNVVHDTHKGTVCLFEPPKESVDSVNQAVGITHVIFPKFNSEIDLEFSDLSKDQVFFSLIENSFNYNVLGEIGFDTLIKTIENVEGFNFQYSNNDEAISAFEGLINDYHAN